MAIKKNASFRAKKQNAYFIPIIDNPSSMPIKENYKK